MTIIEFENIINRLGYKSINDFATKQCLSNSIYKSNTVSNNVSKIVKLMLDIKLLKDENERLKNLIVDLNKELRGRN